VDAARDTLLVMGPGEIVAGRFEVVSALGAGGSATVYRAVDRRTGGAVAVKIAPLEGREQARRFAREVALLAGLDHPAIVRYVAHGTTRDGDGVLAMEWVDARPLSEVLRDPGLDLAESVALATRVAEGLAAAHRAGVVHRDIKPQNILVPAAGPGDARVIDFGVARDPARPALTITGALVGTPPYMAPEQAAGEREVGPAADIFALGCVLYECLTGARAFPGESLLAVRAKVMLCSVTPLRALCPEAPAALEAMVAALMAKAPSLRPRDGAQALAGLRALPAMPATPRRLAQGGGCESTTRAEGPACALVLAAVPRAPAGGHAFARAAGELQLLADHCAVARFPGASAAERAERAARCALELRRAVPEAVLVVVLHGPGELAGGLERGAHALAPEVLRRIFARWAPGAGGVRVDDDAAALLRSRFCLTRDGAGTWFLHDG
jgi:hypothetical protein